MRSFRQGSSRPEVDALVVGTGPGSFTSTRIGVAVARGLALALGIPGAGVSTLDALAAADERAARDRRAPRGGVRARGRPRSCARGRRGGRTVCVGDGAVRYREPCSRRTARSFRRTTTPARRPGRAPRTARDRVRPIDAIEPIYVRAPDAERAG